MRVAPLPDGLDQQRGEVLGQPAIVGRIVHRHDARHLRDPGRGLGHARRGAAGHEAGHRPAELLGRGDGAPRAGLQLAVALLEDGQRRGMMPTASDTMCERLVELALECPRGAQDAAGRMAEHGGNCPMINEVIAGAS